MFVDSIARLFRFRGEGSKIPYLFQRVLRLRLTVTRDLVEILRRPAARPRHLLGHLANTFELFFQERLSHNPFNSCGFHSESRATRTPRKYRSIQMRISTPAAGRVVACAIAEA
jgi:hypothetical protein